MNRFKDLKVWQESICLVAEIYRVTDKFPKKEIYGIVSKINRSAISIPSNIAEGTGKNSKKEFNQFLSIALGSAHELETQLIISACLKFLREELFNKLNTRIENIQKMIYGLQKSSLKTRD